MIIQVNGKFKYKDEGYTQKLFLKISFKLPGKLFKSRIKKTLTNSFWVNNEFPFRSYNDYDEFQKDTLTWLQDENRVEREVEYMVNNYIEEKGIKTDRKENEKEINKLVNNGSFTFNIKIK